MMKNSVVHQKKFERDMNGMVQAWVAHFATTLKCTYDNYDWRVTSQKPHKKHKQHDKQHHHGVGAACPCSGVDLMNPATGGVGGLAHARS